jgi:hypothetical protein
MNEQDANYWTSMVQMDCDEPEVAECLLRHGVELGALEWMDESGRASLEGPGVILHLWKPVATGEPAVFVRGVEFGASYEGSLPHGIDAADALVDIGLKLHPAMPVPGGEPHFYEAVFPEHRLVIQMDADDILQSISWFTTRELSPG